MLKRLADVAYVIGLILIVLAPIIAFGWEHPNRWVLAILLAGFGIVALVVGRAILYVLRSRDEGTPARPAPPRS
jgi:energy-converting hydrogenase Eha subunit G